MLKRDYVYEALIRSVYDGDTVRADVDLGMGVWNRGNDGRGEPLRLHGIDAPEVRGETREAGITARDYLRGLIEGKLVRVQTIKDREGKYGRYLAVIWAALEGDTERLANVNTLMVEAGHAVPASY